jgi:hypothetical protein
MKKKVVIRFVCGLPGRYKREEVKIQAWENREKAKAEAEMRRMEVNNFAQTPFAISPPSLAIVSLPLNCRCTDITV